MTESLLTLSDEQEQLRAVARDLFRSRATSEHVRAVMLNTGLDRELWREMGGMGLLGLLVPEEHGGSHGTMIDMAIVAEESGRRLAPIPLLASAVMATATVLAAGDGDQLTALLPDAVAGQSIMSLVHLDERGRAVNGSGVRAHRDGGAWVLDGGAAFVPAGGEADVLVTAARTEDDSVALFAVPADTAGVTRHPIHVLDLTRPMASVRYDHVLVSDEWCLHGGDPAAALRHGVESGIVALAAEQVGGAQEVLDMTTSYAKDRVQFGRAIGSFQAVKHRLAEGLVKVESARSVARHAAQVLAAGDTVEAAVAVPMAKSLCSEVYEVVAADGIQLHGGIGFTWEHDAHLYLKRAKASKLMLGAPSEHRRRLADTLGF